MNRNHVEIIADSKNTHGQRITTAIVTFPRYLLAEVNTHRALTRSSASSRAIRFEKMVQSVQDKPFIPFKWQKDHPGMQGTEYFDPEQTISNTSEIKVVDQLVKKWLRARDEAVKAAQVLNGEGVTKQICNRLLEPFMYHTALITATEYENFTALRAEGMAEIHLQDVAFKFLEALNASTPKQLQPGEWHIPFGDQMPDSDMNDLLKGIMDIRKDGFWGDKEIQELKVKIATVRCARISYKVPGVDQKIDYAADLALHDRLASSGHWSAFEHCAKAMDDREFEEYTVSYINEQNGMDIVFGMCGNFKGFIQYRKMFPNENRTDSRILKK